MCVECTDKRYTDLCVDCKRAYHTNASRKMRGSTQDGPGRPHRTQRSGPVASLHCDKCEGGPQCKTCRRDAMRARSKARYEAGYTTRKKPSFEGTAKQGRLSQEELHAVSEEVGKWNDALFAYARQVEAYAGSQCEVPLQDKHNDVVLDTRGIPVMVAVCPLCEYCRAEVSKGYDVVCSWSDSDVVEALGRVRGKGEGEGRMTSTFRLLSMYSFSLIL